MWGWAALLGATSLLLVTLLLGRAMPDQRVEADAAGARVDDGQGRARSLAQNLALYHQGAILVAAGMDGAQVPLEAPIPEAQILAALPAHARKAGNWISTRSGNGQVVTVDAGGPSARIGAASGALASLVGALGGYSLTAGLRVRNSVLPMRADAVSLAPDGSGPVQLNAGGDGRAARARLAPDAMDPADANR